MAWSELYFPEERQASIIGLNGTLSKLVNKKELT